MAGVRFVLCCWVALVGVGLAATSARAETLALADVHGEPDVADEAGAVTLLVRSALEGNDRTLLGAPPGFRIADPASLAKVGADHAVALELSREGTGLRVTIVIVSADPKADPDVSYVRAGDGDLQALARGISTRITTQLKLEPGTIPAGSLGQLRPFAAAIRLKPTDATAAAAALADLTTRTTPRPAQQALEGLPARVAQPALAVLAARAIGDLKQLDAIAASTAPVADAARAFAALLRVEASAADAALAASTSKGGLVALARVIVAETRADDRALSDRIKAALATDQERATLAFVSTITPTRLAPALHETLVALVEKHAATSPGVASRIGLAAAEHGVDRTRALGLVSVRELDEPDLERLAPFLAKDDGSATILRLRAELAMRKGDGTEGVAIAAYLRAAESDPRALRYHGWWLVAEGRHAEAAVAFGKANAKREAARALLAADDVRGALAALDARAGETAEELVIEARVALLEKQVPVAVQKLDLAELAAPANPVVHVAILDLVQHAPDPRRARIARLVVERGTSVKRELPAPAADAGSGSAAAQPDPEIVTRRSPDARRLEPLVKALEDLQKLDNGKLAVVEQRWEPSLLAFRVVNATAVRDALLDIVGKPPYRLRLTTPPTTLPDGKLDASQLASALGDADAVLVYRVEPVATDAVNVRLTLHVKATTTAAQAARDVDFAGVVAWNRTKLWLVGIAGTIVLLSIVLWFGRSTGRVKITFDKTADISDEILCVQFTKTPERPPVDDEAKFVAETRKAGAFVKPRLATLITNGQQFRLPSGSWYVHLYGVYIRGGSLRKVPDTCTQSVELRRGDSKTLAFDLSSKLAEVRIVIESEPRRGHTVWADTDETRKLTTDDSGEAVLMLPLGSHTLVVEAQGHRITKPIHLAAIKIERVPFNVARELRIAGDADLAHGAAAHGTSQPVPVAEFDLEPAGPDGGLGVKIRTRPSAKHASTVASDHTMPMVPSDSASGPRAGNVSTGSKPGDMILGRYRIVSELGRGAMGVVRRAWDEKLEREVAIKEMADDLKKSTEAMRLFTQEAKALAQLNHTNIVAMYDQVTETDRVYMIMEYVDGRPLEALLEERERIPWHEAIGIIDQVLAGLAYAHARKVIHRDIKPANIFVASDGVVKIGDFGLARVLREVTIRKTEIRGTPLYMAPEQITGTNVDHRADLYAVGCTLFELVTGRPPHIEGDILYAQLHTKAPEASTLVAGLPPALDALIEKLIAKQSDARFASANEVRAALRKLG